MRCLNYVNLLIAFNLVFLSFAQSTSEMAYLDELDDAAFVALEANAPDANGKALILLKEAKAKKSALHEINAYTILGIINKNKGYFITSVNDYMKALNAAERIDDDGRISACYNNIGTVYQLQENYPKALVQFHKSLAIEEKLGNPLQKSIRYYNIGEVYNEMDSLDLALSYFNNSLLIEKQEGNNEGILYALLGITDVYLNLERAFEAEISLEKIEKLLSPELVEENILYYNLKGRLCLLRNEVNEAFKAFETAIESSKQNQFVIHLPELYLNKIAVLKLNKDWQNASKTYESYIKLHDELNNTRIKNQLEDLTFQNELNKKELEIRLIKEDRDLARKNEKTEKAIAKHELKIVWFLVISIVLILILILLGVRRISRNNE